MVLDSHYARKIMPDPSLQGYSNLGMEEARITLVADQKTEQDHLSGFSEEKKAANDQDENLQELWWYRKWYDI